MNRAASIALKELMADGWEVKGFQVTMGSSQVGDAAASDTDGYTILLQKNADLALVWVAHQAGAFIVKTVSIITDSK